VSGVGRGSHCLISQGLPQEEWSLLQAEGSTFFCTEIKFLHDSRLNSHQGVGMRYFVISLLLLTCASANAQPWQWEQYAGDFYNPTGFPIPDQWEFSSGSVGDFSGDGRDEYFGGTNIAVRDSVRFHWTAYTLTQAPIGHGGLAINLDADAADELITFSLWTDSTHAWKLTSSDPWTWQQRDDLLSGLSFPPGTYKAVVGDYDGDGLLNAVCWKGFVDVDTVRYYTRLFNGTWQAGTIFYPGVGSNEQVVNLLDGDFDQDGDLDFGIMTEPPADPPTLWGYFYENTGSGIAPPIWNVLFFSAGGDLDGDGDWDGLSQEFFRAGYSMVHTAPSSSFFRVTASSYLGRFEGRVFGNLRVNGQTVVAGVYNHTEIVIPPWETYSFWVEHPTPMGWVTTPCGFYSYFGSHCVSASLSDLDGDGHNDLLGIMVATNGGVSWRVYQNTGSDSTDLFNTARALPSSIPSQRNAIQIGDITGDGRAELGLLTPAPGESFQILFYEMIGAIADTNFALHSDWNSGLPSALNFRLADIDGDGTCEAMLYSGSSWESYFFRNGHWDLYTGILPPVTASDISFADADNDGDLDLFTPDEVWLNLNPDAIDRDFIPHPSSLALSCFPNPFNAQTEIRFALPQAARVELALFDILGRRVATLANEVLATGEHSVPFDGSNLGSGIYFAHLSASHRQTALKLMLIR